MLQKKQNIQKIAKWLGARIRALRACILALIAPTSKNEDSRRQELILNIILFISLLFLTLLDITIIFNSIRFYPHYDGINWILFTSIVVSCGLLLVASKRGYARIVSYTIIGIYSLGALYGGWHWGVSLPAILLSFALISVTSSILIGSRFGFIVSGLIIISLTTLSVHEIYSLGILPWKYETITVTDVVTYSAILLFIAALSWLSNQEIRKSLDRARASENALARERDLLEIKVEERTEELRKAQIERIAEISRIAEFGRLSQGLFHDLMTPLSSVALHMEKLNNLDTIEFNEARNYLDKAVAASHKMGSFMNLIRSHIKQGDPQKPSQKNEFSINAELDATIELLKYKAREAKVSIIVKSEEKILHRSNAIYFQRIFLNLISNAIEALETIQTENKDKIIEITASKKRNMITITISDNGPGISSNDIDHIFKAFYSTKSPEKGMGVGLSTVKSIVEENLGGTIGVKSVPNEKTSFSISFPV